MKPLRGHSLSNPDRSVCVFDVTVMKCGETVRFGFYSRPHSLYSLVHSPTADLSIGSDPQEPHALPYQTQLLRGCYECCTNVTIGALFSETLQMQRKHLSWPVPKDTTGHSCTIFGPCCPTLPHNSVRLYSATVMNYVLKLPFFNIRYISLKSTVLYSAPN